MLYIVSRTTSVEHTLVPQCHRPLQRLVGYIKVLTVGKTQSLALPGYVWQTDVQLIFFPVIVTIFFILFQPMTYLFT